MISATTPSSNGWKGGLYAPADRPTAVGGAGFGAPGTAAQTPPGVPASSIMQARNNPGTNIRIPYARECTQLEPQHAHARTHARTRGQRADVGARAVAGLVPMHARVRTMKNAAQKYRGQQVLATVDGKDALEYEGLRGGELAWILGRRMVRRSGGEYDMARDGDRPLHMTASVMGEGVNRMQRLASTPWMEAMFANRFQDAHDNPLDHSINLHTLELDQPSCTMLDSQLNEYKALLKGSTALHSSNLTALYMKHDKDTNKAKLDTIPKKIALGMAEGPTRQPFSGGFRMIEQGPFLCGREAARFGDFDMSSSLLEFTQTTKGAEGASDVKHHIAMPLDAGDAFAQRALEAEMRNMDMMDWTPDGLILSKLASPAGDTLAQEELDAQSAQLFNVAVQGPALSTVWTSDLNGYKGDHKLACQPMDKVFVCIVATLAYKIGPKVEGVGPAETALHKELLEFLKGEEAALENITRLSGVLSGAQTDLRTGAPSTVAEDSEAGATERQQRLQGALNSWGNSDEDKLARLREFESMARDELDSDRYATEARLSGFRLMRTTSSHMTNFSKFVPTRTRDGVNHTRLGLPLEFPQADDAASVTGVGEYIVGGWCVGTVLDSAASRSTVHNQVRTAPASMAMNVNVNIEWWGASKLRKHYMDNSIDARAGVKPRSKRSREEGGLRAGGLRAGPAEGDEEGEEY